MNKRFAFRPLGVGLVALCVAGVALAFAADQSSATSSSGATTTYFAPSLPSSATTPNTTGALPDPTSEGNVSGSPTSAPVPPAATAEPPATPAPAVTPAATEQKVPETQAPAAAATPATPSATPAATAAPTALPAATTTLAAPPPANPVVDAIRTKLSEKSLAGRDNVKEDVAALSAFYASRTDPLWTKDGAYTAEAKAIISELQKADDWGLESTDFVVADIPASATPEQQGIAEAQLGLAALKYARFARGGRLSPVSLSNILDMKPPVKDAKTVVAELTASSDPGAYLRNQNPKHAGFEKLRQVLLKARGPRQDVEAVDPALLVKLPDGKTLKPGAEDDQISLLRQRLKVPAEQADQERVYDDKLVAAVKEAQQSNGMKATGVFSNKVRAALNKEGEPKKADPKRDTDRIVANMERWRWLPENLGAFYVMNNIPEFSSEIWKGDKIALKQKMIVGQPSWPTPVLAATMTIVATHPSWGMPPGIKAKELLPRVRSASTGFDFFDQLFGGGSGAGSVIRAYKLQAFCNGHQVDPDYVTADNIQNCGFTQPPGPDNPLGIVKFRFPNDHDVYMHDTPERALFSQSMRALSHGCMRVEEPKRTAEIILGEDKGWSAEKVEGLFAGSTDVTLSKPFPVYLVYFTARVDDEGHLDRYGDIYGHDDRIMAALRGHPVRYIAPEALDPSEANADRPSASAEPAARPKKSQVSDAGADDLQDAPPPPVKKSKTGNKQANKRKGGNTNSTNSNGDGSTVGDFMNNALSGAF